MLQFELQVGLRSRGTGPEIMSALTTCVGTHTLLNARFQAVHSNYAQLETDFRINMRPSNEISESDIVFNQASLALAKSQRLIASWLPPRTPTDVDAKTEVELEKQESEVFSPVSEL
jgi:Protein of unknown function (DUF3245)